MIPDGKRWSPSTARAVERRKCHKPPMDSLHVCSRLRAHHWSSPQEGLAGIVKEGDRVDRQTNSVILAFLPAWVHAHPALTSASYAGAFDRRGHRDRLGISASGAR